MHGRVDRIGDHGQTGVRDVLAFTFVPRIWLLLEELGVMEEGRVKVDDRQLVFFGDRVDGWQHVHRLYAFIGHFALPVEDRNRQRDEDLGMGRERLVALDQVLVSVLETLQREYLSRCLVQAPIMAAPRSDDHDVRQEGDALFVANAIARVGAGNVGMRLGDGVALQHGRAAVAKVAHLVARAKQGLQLGWVLLHANWLGFAIACRKGMAVGRVLTNARDLDRRCRGAARAKSQRRNQ